MPASTPPISRRTASPFASSGTRPLHPTLAPTLAPALAPALALWLTFACVPARASPPSALPPDPSCEPLTLAAGPLRIAAWSCALPTGRWHVRAEPALPGFALWIDDARRETVVHALPRAPGAPLSSVLATLARAGHVPPDDCVFVRVRDRPAPPGTRVYEIRPAGRRLAALRAAPADQVPDPPCGEYGWSTHGVRGFVVDPRHPRWIVYVNLGQDGTLIDPAKLTIAD